MSSPRAAGPHPSRHPPVDGPSLIGDLGSVREEQASGDSQRHRQVEAEHPLNQVDPPVQQGELGFDTGEPVFVSADLLSRLGGFFRRCASLNQAPP
jgi:hypothetical protein